ncbi:MAG: glycosyltransferase family 9 protein [Ignavibacteria bacterium]|nr:glycosyltransferase family 9 protein [Ignavibacteria bacterium]
MKNIFLEFLRFLLKSKKKNLPQISELIKIIGKSPKILIVRQHNQLGDMLLSNSLFRAIKENIPECVVTLIASEENYQAVVSNKFIDKLIVLEKLKMWNPIHLFDFFKSLRKEEFDLAIVPVTVSVSFTSCLIARLSGAKFTIGPSSLDNIPVKYSFMFDYKIEVGDSSNLKKHISDKILDIVRPFGIETKDLSEHILISDEDKKFASEFFSKINELKVGFHIGAGKIPNRWSVKNFATIINYVKKEYNAFVYLTIGHWDEELLNEILPFLSFKPEILKNFPLPKLAAIIDQSDLFISNDTGIMHVAGSTNTNLIALFGPTDPEVWAPIGKNKFYIKKDDDINSIKPDDVTHLINQILEIKK